VGTGLACSSAERGARGERRARLPASAALVVLVALACTAALAGYYRLRGPVLRQEALERQQRIADGLARRLSADFATAEQLVRTNAALAQGLEGDRTEAERVLRALVGSASTATVYGAGLWFEPYAFQSDIRYFGPYVHRDRSGGEGLVLTYEWCTEAYDYPSHQWYLDAVAATGATAYSEPYFDVDYVYVTTSRSILDNQGRVRGVATVGMVVPTLRETVAAVAEADVDAVCVTTAKGAVLLHPDEAGLLDMAASLGLPAKSVVDVDIDTMRLYEARRGRGGWVENAATVEPVGWTVHVFADPVPLFGAERTLRHAVEALVVGVWLLGLLATVGLVVVGEQARRATRRSEELTEEVDSLRRAQEALRRSEERFRAVFDNAAVGIFVIDGSGRYVRANERWTDMLGIPFEALREVPPTDLLHPDGRERGVATLERLLRGELHSHREEARCLRPDGALLWVDLLTSTMPGSSPGERTVLGVAVDITAAKLAEEERRELNQRFHRMQRLESIGVLAGGVAHDFNNILAAVIGYTELAIGGLPPASVEHSHLGNVLSAAERARNLVRQILAFSRQTELQPRAVRLQDVLAEALAFARASLPTTIEIEARSDPDCSSVLADPTQVHQVLMNLFTNAAHAMRDGGGTLTVALEQVALASDRAVWLGLPAGGDYACVTVHDSGCGMDATTRERVFEPFFSTKSVGEGTGLGLSTAHGIVTSHGGAIELESEPGLGTTFRVYLPCVPDAEQLQEAEAEPIPRGSGRVLLVDDDEAVAHATERMLLMLGYEVTTRTDSTSAIGLIESTPDAYDIVVTDLTMPRATGLEVASRTRRASPGTPVLLVSGQGEALPPAVVRDAGISACLSKPYTVRRLGEAVRNCLDGQRRAE
jgi:PAS domain S-box-containing protein